MAAIRISRFGGLKPRSLDDALPPDAATAAVNLRASTMEFQPLGEDETIVATTGYTDPVSIYRHQRKADGTLNTAFDSAANWRYSMSPVSLAKYPNNDDTTDRHVVTFNDGSTAPVWIDATGASRQLGVPAPTAAPGVTLNAVDEFSTEDRASELEVARQGILDAIRGTATPVMRGAAHPGTSTTGYLDQTTDYFTNPSPYQMVRTYRLGAAGGAVTDPYVTGATAEDYAWIFDPILAGFYGTATGTPAWGGAAGTPHYALSFAAYGLTYDLDIAAITASVAALPMPGKTDGTKLFTTAQVTALTDKLEAYVDPDGDVAGPKIQALAAKVAQVKALLDGGPRTSIVAQRAAYYARADVAAAKTAAIAATAEAIWATAYNIAMSQLPPENAGPGNGSY
jgi:hypothetical protein